MVGPVTLLARHVLPLSAAPLDGGWVRVERGRIAAIGRGRPPAPVVDLGDAIVLPGLVNAHTHLEFSDLERPLSAEGGLPAWIDRVVGLRRGRGPEDGPRRTAAIRAGLRESAAAGVTAVGEIATGSPPRPGGRDPRVRAFREALGLTPSAMVAARRALARDLVGMIGGGHAGISPHAPYSVGDPLGRQIVREAARRGLPVAMHLAESREELELLATGSGPLRAVLEGLGAWSPAAPPRLRTVEEWISLLARAPRGCVVHGTFLPDLPAALARLARHRDRLCVVVCPRTTRALVGRPPPLEAFRAAGIRVAIGTDSRASNPDLSVLAEAAALVDAGKVGPDEAIGMATLAGAWALGFERRCGRLAPGRQADLAILRPAGRWGEPYEAAVDPTTRVVATLRRGRLIAGDAAVPA